jgi:hypothetical protein
MLIGLALVSAVLPEFGIHLALLKRFTRWCLCIDKSVGIFSDRNCYGESKEHNSLVLRVFL